MPLIPLNFKPGINRETTSHTAEGGWFSCDKVRFRAGMPEKIGGWVKYSASAFRGICRALFNWVTLDSANYMAVGTNLKYYVERGGTFFDITPLRRTISLVGTSLATTSGSRVVVVTDTAHGAVDGDFVTISGALAVNGIPAGELNTEFQLTFLTGNTYSITVATTPANASSAGGGTSVAAQYQINVGQASATTGDGWGSSTWGRGGWGSGSSVFVPTADLRTWTQTNFGEDLLFCPRNSAIYLWDSSAGTGSRAVTLTSITGASNVPTVASAVVFTDDRHLVAFGTNPINSSVQDPMFIRWASQESLLNWTPGITNSAGGQRLTSGNYIVSHLKMRQETLVWTDSDLYSMQYTGAPYIFSFSFLARNISVAGPNAVATAGDTAFWMGQDKFYLYNGRVQTLRCDVWKYVFTDIRRDQMAQVFCGTNEGFSEVIWFYVSAAGTYCDRYVIYNHQQDIWYYGALARTAWLDSPLRSHPIGTGTDSYVYDHENGLDDGSSSPPAAINAYIESADVDIGEGDRIMFIKRVIPDVSFEGSSAASPVVTMTLKARPFPGSAVQSTQASAVARSASSPIELYTNDVWVRLRGRQATFRIESSTNGVQWQLGKPRVDAQPDGRR